MPPEVKDLSLEQVMDQYVALYAERVPDWYAFEDAKIEGWKRAQHRFIGAGASGKHGDPDVIPARGFTLTIMCSRGSSTCSSRTRAGDRSGSAWGRGTACPVRPA
jgi:hypothetical protein